MSSSLHRRFLPTRFANCVLWLDAAKGITLATGVAQWNDQSGNGNHVAQASGSNQPAYTTASTLMRGRPAIVFTGASSHSLILDAFAAAFTGDDMPVSIFLAYTATTVAATACMVGWGRGASATPFSCLQHTTAPALAFNRRDDANVNNSISTTAPAVGTPHIASLVYSPAVDLVVQGASGGLAQTLTTGVMTLDRFAIGSLRRNSESQFFTGEIYEVIIYSRAVGTRERKTIERYLGQKYCLRASTTK